MKRLLALALCFLLAIGTLTGCGSESSSDDTATENSKNDATITAKIVEIDLTSEEYAFGVDKNQPQLLREVNNFISKIKKDGTFDEICNHYFGDGTPVAVTSAKFDESKDQLVVATNAAFEPFEYMKGDSYYGVDMELAAALAEYLGKELVIQNMDFDAVCLAVGQMKCDIAMAGLTIKEDRKSYVNFSDPYYSASQKLIVPSTNDEFDFCKDVSDVEEILASKDQTTRIGVQTGTTAQFYVEGDESWGFTPLTAKAIGYKNGALAVQDLLNGNIDYVIIDSAPAERITEALNAMQ